VCFLLSDDSERSEEVCRVVRVWTRRRQGVLRRQWRFVCVCVCARGRVVSHKEVPEGYYDGDGTVFLYLRTAVSFVYVYVYACVCILYAVRRDAVTRYLEWQPRGTLRGGALLRVHYNIAQSWTSVPLTISACMWCMYIFILCIHVQEEKKKKSTSSTGYWLWFYR